jgi:hypothetical protein
MTLEDAGFCRKGEDASFLANRDLSFRGDFPAEPAQAASCRSDRPAVRGGMHHVCDATRQLMGRAAAQVSGCHTAFVSGNHGISASRSRSCCREMTMTSARHEAAAGADRDLCDVVRRTARAPDPDPLLSLDRSSRLLYPPRQARLAPGRPAASTPSPSRTGRPLQWAGSVPQFLAIVKWDDVTRVSIEMVSVARATWGRHAGAIGVLR